MLTPEDIESREFLVSLRGYDRDEVAAFLGRVAAEVRELREQLERARSQPPRPEPAPAAPVSAVPAVPAAPAASEIFGDVARETQRILEAAQEAAANLQRKARQEIDRELQQARSRAARHIADGERRREAIERVVSELESRRDALAEALRSVGRTVDETLRELVPAPEPTASVREALLAEAAAASEAAAPAAAAPADDAPVGEVVTSTTPDADVEADTDGAGADAGAGPDAGAEAGPGAAEDSDAERVDEEGAGGADVDVEDAGAAEPPAPAVADDEVPPEHGASEPAAQEDEAAADVSAADTTAPDAEVSTTDAASTSDTATGAGVPAAAETSAPGPAAAAASATAAAASPSAEARPDVAAAAETPAPEPAPVAAAPADEAITFAEGDDQGKPRALRAQALSPLHPRLVRQVKRELQELQNVTLDALRRAGGQGKPEAFGPDDESYQQLGRAVEDLLRQAYTAGIGSAGTLVGRELDSPSRSRQLGGDFRREAAGRIDEAVAATLRVAMQAQEDLPGLSDRVGGVYTELKSTGAEELAASHLVRSYELGMLDTWAANGITHRRWILGREPRCPEGRCRHNDSAGVVALHDDFPSGHAAPPVHVGCTCTTIPITEPPA